MNRLQPCRSGLRRFFHETGTACRLANNAAGAFRMFVKSKPKRPFTHRKSLLIPLKSRLFERRIS